MPLCWCASALLSLASTILSSYSKVLFWASCFCLFSCVLVWEHVANRSSRYCSTCDCFPLYYPKANHMADKGAYWSWKGLQKSLVRKDPLVPYAEALIFLDSFCLWPWFVLLEEHAMNYATRTSLWQTEPLPKSPEGSRSKQIAICNYDVSAFIIGW